MPATDPGAPIADQLVDALVQASFATMAVLNRLAAEHDLSLTSLRVLGILRDRRLRMSELVEYLGLDKSTLTGLVARAEQRGLVSRSPNAHDRRAVDVFLAPAGRALAVQVTARVRESLAPLFDALTPAERDRLRRLLEQLTGSG